MTGSRLLACFAAIALSTSACGFFGSSDSGGGDVDASGAEIGADVVSPTTRRTIIVTTLPPTTAAPRANPNACRPGNDTTEVSYDPGIVVKLTVNSTCLARGADLRMTMTVTNRSSGSVGYNPNQVEFFSIKPPRGDNKSSWRDRDCSPARPGEKTVASLNPGQTLTFNGTYPAPPGVASREQCRKLANGAYDVYAVFVLCEGEAETDGYCEISKGEQLFAQPLRITVDAD